METSRQRGNPAGNTNSHVAGNVRRARQAIGMDLRTFADQVKQAGRAMSASALSKLENGDRRVDVDDLTVFAYVLQTSPAALLSPPEDPRTGDTSVAEPTAGTPSPDDTPGVVSDGGALFETGLPTGVPGGWYTAEELQAWVRGQTKLTTESLVAYWKDQYYVAVNSVRYYETLMAQHSEGRQPDPRQRATYEQRLASGRARRDTARLRLLALDPDALPAPRDDAVDGWA